MFLFMTLEDMKMFMLMAGCHFFEIVKNVPTHLDKVIKINLAYKLPL